VPVNNARGAGRVVSSARGEPIVAAPTGDARSYSRNVNR
jgi:hypothetical protein